MHLNKTLGRSRAVQDISSLQRSSLFGFLVPALSSNQQSASIQAIQRASRYQRGGISNAQVSNTFFTALSRASTCHIHAKRPIRDQSSRNTRRSQRLVNFSTTRACRQDGEHQFEGLLEKAIGEGRRTLDQSATVTPRNRDVAVNGKSNSKRQQRRSESENPGSHPRASTPSRSSNSNHQRCFAEGSTLPERFFDDVHHLQSLIEHIVPEPIKADRDPAKKAEGKYEYYTTFLKPPWDTGISDEGLLSTQQSPLQQDRHEPDSSAARLIHKHTALEEMKLLQSVRHLEEKLAQARRELTSAVQNRQSTYSDVEKTESSQPLPRSRVILTKEDYKNLVDLYYYSHNSRFSPEATDSSPTPIFLEDFSFELSKDFSEGEAEINENETYSSPLQHIDQMLRSGKMREVAVMQVFVDLLLDDKSSNRALYEAYKALPDPGVAFLPPGVIRLFLQRMSTPWTHSEKSMLRYLSLIDDMQKAKLPITRAEWSSAVYLAGRSFSKVTEQDLASSLRIWQVMENDAGIKSSSVTFNILFDIAVRAGKFALGQTILMEMSKRNLRLNRLGRVSLIYYHGLRGDGDGVRKTYRDFVEAGEIVDTLVLNCVMASLYNAQEPAAAEQIYERMKSLQNRQQKKESGERAEEAFHRYPPPGGQKINSELARNHLGRILLGARNLRDRLPEHHASLQALMPLTPNRKTFQSMISYHATKSGDLDRISVLLNEMTDLFGIPLESMNFQILFKGFAIHGPITGAHGLWSTKRLELCWKACRDAIAASQRARSHGKISKEKKQAESESVLHNTATIPNDNVSDSRTILPSVEDVNSLDDSKPIPAFNPSLHNPPPRRLSSWNMFVLDLAAFPRQRLNRIERFHAQMFDEENAKQDLKGDQSPEFQSTVYTSPQENLDHEEGEYTLPSLAEPALIQPGIEHKPTTSDYESNEPDSPHNESTTHFESNSSSTSRLAQRHNTQATMTATRPLVCWLLRAYSRNFGSRTKLEKVWTQVRKVWNPKDELERDSVVRVYRRCLRDCDRGGI